MKKFISMMLCIATIMSAFTFSGVTAGAATVGNTMPFIDVEQTWYYSGVEFCYANGIVSGTTAVTFEPNTTLTRAMFVMMMAKTADADLGIYTESSFDDVAVDKWYFAAVEWAAQNEITSGIGEGCFGPDNVMTREQLCTLLYNYMKNNSIACDDTLAVLDEYSDKADISSWAEQGVAASVNAGLVTGTSAEVKLMSPKKNLVRSEASRVFYIFMSEVLCGDCEHVYADATCTEAQTCSACGIKSGMPAGHEAEGVSCTDAEFVCTVCGETVEISKYNLHTYEAATCTRPSKCSVCGVILAKALGHTTDNGKCTRCNEVVFRNVTDKVKHYITEKGVATLPGIMYYYSGQIDYDDGSYDIVSLDYDIFDNMLTMIYKCYIPQDDAVFSINIEIPYGKQASSYRYTSELRFISDGEASPMCVGSGILYPSSVKDGMYFVFDSYSGAADYRYDFNMSIYYLLLNQVYYTDWLLDDLCGADITAYGFPSQR